MDTAQIAFLILTGIVLPGVASLLSRQHFPSMVTAGITVVLAAVTGFATDLADSGNFHWSTAVVKSGLAYVAAAVARSQFWRGTTGDAKLLAFPRKLPPNNVQPGEEPAGIAQLEADAA